MTNQNDTQHDLLNELAAAVAARLAGTSAEASPARTVAAAVEGFLAARKPRLSPGAYRAYAFALATHFCAEFGPRVLTTLGAEEVEDWAARPRGDPPKVWSDSYRNTTLGAVSTFLRWAKHPIRIARPQKESRGADTVLDDAQFAAVLAAYDVRHGGADFREFLRVLRETGARPQEVARLTAEAVDWPNRCVRLKQHKTRRHTAERVIHFSAAAFAILEAQRAKHGGGFLFRTRAGKPYRTAIIGVQMRRISRRVGYRCIAYGLGRHSFATKALVNGVPDAVVAALLGHKSTTMVHSNYGHVGDQAKVLKEAVERISGA